MYIVWCIVGSVLWGLAGRADISILRQRPADDELLTADTAALTLLLLLPTLHCTHTNTAGITAPYQAVLQCTLHNMCESCFAVQKETWWLTQCT